MRGQWKQANADDWVWCMPVTADDWVWCMPVTADDWGLRQERGQGLWSCQAVAPSGALL
jgi:hypothetical protein